jgi:hypothetical protein
MAPKNKNSYCLSATRSHIEGVEVYLHSFLTSAPDGGGWCTRWIGEWVGLRVGGPQSGWASEPFRTFCRKVSCLYCDSNPGPPSPQRKLCTVAAATTCHLSNLCSWLSALMCMRMCRTGMRSANFRMQSCTDSVYVTIPFRAWAEMFWVLIYLRPPWFLQSLT